MITTIKAIWFLCQGIEGYQRSLSDGAGNPCLAHEMNIDQNNQDQREPSNRLFRHECMAAHCVATFFGPIYTSSFKPESSSVVLLPMSMMLILQEEVFVSAVYRKCHRRDAQAGEATLESVPSRERSGVSPRFSDDHGESA